MMGSPADEPERRDNEPQVRVTIRRAFAIGKTEVTWDQWEACVRDRWCDGPGVETALRANEDGTPNKAFVDWGRGSRPVVGVSWYDAQHFVGWLNWKKSQDDAYRLPSEAEARRSLLPRERHCGAQSSDVPKRIRCTVSHSVVTVSLEMGRAGVRE